MTARKQILSKFNKDSEIIGLYDELKKCLLTKDPLCPEIDEWFKGVIQSLYYKPNINVLVLEGEDGIGKTRFLHKLMYSCDNSDVTCIENYIYTNLIFNTQFTNKSDLILPMCSNFSVELGEYPCDKRLASYCSATRKWVYPQRRNFIVIPVLGIDLVKLRKIDMFWCWIEIFNMFKR